LEVFGHLFGPEASSLAPGSSSPRLSSPTIFAQAADGIRWRSWTGAGCLRVVGVDLDADIAVLKTVQQGCHMVTFGQAERARVGDVVLAIGNPFGVGQTVTFGIVGALGQTGRYQHLRELHSDRRRNQSGNSGSTREQQRPSDQE
jgi:hypothetical protein